MHSWKLNRSHHQIELHKLSTYLKMMNVYISQICLMLTNIFSFVQSDTLQPIMCLSLSSWNILEPVPVIGISHQSTTAHIEAPVSGICETQMWDICMGIIMIFTTYIWCLFCSLLVKCFRNDEYFSYTWLDYWVLSLWFCFCSFPSYMLHSHNKL